MVLAVGNIEKILKLITKGFLLNCFVTGGRKNATRKHITSD